MGDLARDATHKMRHCAELVYFPYNDSFQSGQINRKRRGKYGGKVVVEIRPRALFLF